ncbi:MAG: cupin domain-containing protein [Halobacteriaceae archaeon]
MRDVSLDDLDSRIGPASVSRPLSDALGTTNLAINYYELGPGESSAYGFHAHEAQEEVFYVQAGTVTFRTADGDVTADAGDLVRFGPGEYQRCVNEGEDRATLLVVGAPREAGETEVLRYCAECATETPQSLELVDEKDAIEAVCEECGAVTGRFEA